MYQLTQQRLTTLNGYPRFPWSLKLHWGTEILGHHTQKNCIFSCHTEQHWPSVARPRRSQRFPCGEGTWSGRTEESIQRHPQRKQDHGNGWGTGSFSQWLRLSQCKWSCPCTIAVFGDCRVTTMSWHFCLLWETFIKYFKRSTDLWRVWGSLSIKDTWF